MRKAILSILGGAVFALPLMFASCGNIDNPLEIIDTSGSGGGGGGSEDATTISYVKYTGTVAGNETVTSYTEWKGVLTAGELTEGTYVLVDDATLTGNFTLGGDVNIILCDGKTLTITGSILGMTHDLKIFAQSAGTGELSIGTPGTEEEEFAVYVKNLEIHGGSIIAAGGGTLYGAGLEAETKFTLYNGDIHASGTGSGVMTAAFEFYGGKIQAMGGTNAIYGTITTHTGADVDYDNDTGAGWTNAVAGSFTDGVGADLPAGTIAVKMPYAP